MACSFWRGTALNLDIFAAAGIGEAVSDNITSALFVTLGNFPISSIMSFLAIILIAAFFITSADSGTFVVAMLTSGREQEPARKLKAAWGILLGGVAADDFHRLGSSFYAGYAYYVLLFAERLFTGSNLLTVKPATTVKKCFYGISCFTLADQSPRRYSLFSDPGAF